MGIKTSLIPVYTIDVFDTDNDFFWIGRLDSILERFPDLERPHKQYFYMLLYIEEAGGSIIIDDHTVKLDQPKVISVQQGSVCRMDINRNAGGTLICFTESYFSLRYNDNVLLQFEFLKKCSDTAVSLSGKQQEKWELLLSLMQEEYSFRVKGWEKVLRSYLNILLYEFDRGFGPPALAEKAGGKEEKVLAFEKLIEKHYAGVKQPGAYASMLYISTNYLNKLCRHYRGATAGTLIRQRIIVEARRLLYHTAFTVSEIAVQLGFEHVSYFVTFFKTNTGQTPENFRKRKMD